MAESASGLQRRDFVQNVYEHSSDWLEVRSVADQLFAVGTDLPTARAQMGHHSATFTANVYGHADPRRAREAGEKVGALLWTR